MPTIGLFGTIGRKLCNAQNGARDWARCRNRLRYRKSSGHDNGLARPGLLSISIFTFVASALVSAGVRAQTADIDLAADGLPPLPAMPTDADFAALSPQATNQTLLDLGFLQIDIASLMILSLVFALSVFSLFTGFAFIREKRRAFVQLREKNQTIQTLQHQLDQSESLLNATEQLLVVWDGQTDRPEFIGNLNFDTHLLATGQSVLAFGSWLSVDCAQEVERAVTLLRERGVRFEKAAETLGGNLVEIRGRTSGARALLQIRQLEADDVDRARLDLEASRQSQELTRLKHLLDAMPMPVWSRNDEGTISWVNEAYRQAVEADSIQSALDEQSELLDERGRTTLQQDRDQDPDKVMAVKRMPIIVAGKRHIYDVVDFAFAGGSVGIATDATEHEAAERALDRMQAFHADMMDQLTSPVAIFDSTQSLQYYNSAYGEQFKLDATFLNSHPQESSILDRLRTNRCLPEQADYHGWKNDFLSSYNALEPREHWWHLPDGQSLRVVATPNPDGGVTYIFENVTEQLDLEKRYNALFRMQSETLDHLRDGVVVFGSDGRLRVSNPAFSNLWDFHEGDLADQPHVGAVLEWCRKKYSDARVWAGLKGSVVGLEDKRMGRDGRMELSDGRFLDYAAVPLPDGATMITFVDVTDNVKVARGLQDRNEALMAADQLKNTFIQHVSYELRSPLTNIIGFTELMTSEAFGALNERQRDYTDHIMASSSSLLTIVNDILDLATIDAGIMELELEPVDPVDSIRAAAEGLQDRLAEKDISLNISVAENMGDFSGDRKRVRQVLYNLISNAIAFSEKGSEVSVIADRRADVISFSVWDHGCGIEEDYHDQAFDRFESRKTGNGRGGTGLGLSIVKSFVELHGGAVSIDSTLGEGTQVTCFFPIDPKKAGASSSPLIKTATPDVISEAAAN